MLIIHGNNQVASRKRLTQLTDNFKGEIVRLEANKLDLTALIQAIESQSLFGTDKLTVIENLFGRRPSKAKEEIFTYLKKNFPVNLIIWENAKVDGRTLLPFSKAKVEKFEIGQVLYRFLDNLAPNNQKNNLLLFYQCLNQNEPELVMYLLAKQLRLLIIGIDLGQKGLDKVPSWKKSLIIRQAKKFDLKKLISLLQKLLDIEYGQKTGQSPFDLITHLDLWLTSF